MNSSGLKHLLPAGDRDEELPRHGVEDHGGADPDQARHRREARLRPHPRTTQAIQRRHNEGEVLADPKEIWYAQKDWY